MLVMYLAVGAALVPSPTLAPLAVLEAQLAALKDGNAMVTLAL